MPEVEELVVAMKAEGLDETVDDLEDASDEMDETANDMDDSAGMMEAFSQEWEGAMGAVVAGLAVAAAGLLSQVPIIGELMQSLFSVVEAIAFQIDQVLRPVLQPVTDAFFDLSAAIFKADGIIGDIIGVVAALGAAFAGLVAIELAVGAISGFVASSTLLTAAGGAIVSALGAVAGAISLPVLAIGALIAAVGALAVAFITDFKGIRTATVNGVKGVLGALKDLTVGFADWAAGLLSDALQWGKDLVINFAKGIRDNAALPIDAAGNVISGIADSLSFDQRENDRMMNRWGRDMMAEFGMGMETGRRREIPNPEIQAGDGQDRDVSGTEKIGLFLDGRELDKGTRRYRDKPLNRRGRFG